MNSNLKFFPEARDLLMEIFHTDNKDELREIAMKAQKYDKVFGSNPPANIRKAGRKPTFKSDDIALMMKMHQGGKSMQEIACHFHTTRQTVTKYLAPERRIANNPFITMRMLYMYEDELCTTIDIDFMNRKIYITNHTDDIIHRAFGTLKEPGWKDFEQFLEGRCFPRTRANLKDILRDIGVSSYDPLQIIEKTQGRMAEDRQWIKIIYMKKGGDR